MFSFRQTTGDSAPTHIVVRTTPEQRVTFRRISDGWNAEAQPIRWRPQEMRIEGAIDNSLYEALDAGVSDEQLDSGNRQRLAWDLADVYAWEIDFTRDIRPGDRFQVVFERLVSEDGEARFGRVLASDLTISGKELDRHPVLALHLAQRGLLRCRRGLAPPGVSPRAGRVSPDLLELCQPPVSIRCSG